MTTISVLGDNLIEITTSDPGRIRELTERGLQGTESEGVYGPFSVFTVPWPA